MTTLTIIKAPSAVYELNEDWIFSCAHETTDMETFEEPDNPFTGMSSYSTTHEVCYHCNAYFDDIENEWVEV